MDENPTKKRRSIPMEWIIVGACFIDLALVYSVQYSFSVFFVTFVKEFGWSRSTISGAFSLFVIFGSIVGPPVGALIAAIGPRRVILLGSLILGGGLALCGLTRAWWQYYLYFGLVTAVGVGATGWIPNVTLIQIWFREKRGLAMGIISSGIGIGILVFVPLTQHLILRIGWRKSYFLMAAFIPLVVILLAMTLLRRSPPVKASTPSRGGGFQPSARDPRIVDEEWTARSWTLRQAMRTKRFWLLGLVFFLGNVLAQSIFAHQVAFFVDRGLGAVFASYLVGLVGISSLGGKILWGAMSDRIGRELTFTLGMISFLCGMLILILFNYYPFRSLPFLYTVCFALGYAVTAALPPLITADLFEGPAYGSIFGAFMAFTGLGAAAGAWCAGLLYDWTGSYVPTFILLVVFSLISCLCIWWAAPGKVRRVPGRIASRKAAV